MQDRQTAAVAVNGRDRSLDILRDAGYLTFEDYWNSPREFVDDVNYRRNGWSAVSLIELELGDGSKRRYYLKRQENQIRYSLRHPLGALTYQFEVEAVAQMARQLISCVSVLDYGFRRNDGKRQGYVVTEAIDGECLKDFANSDPDWSSVSEQISSLSKQLFRMHANGWQHGALYPVHIFMN
ncbi:MAG: lipopolysaccharide kinase InaA family protein, partial [Pseudohongiellaceae bacterium]|nr:lipopolysaccharide kinase InaA family protein [Pseudohongiellaceae bacterium]